MLVAEHKLQLRLHTSARITKQLRQSEGISGSINAALAVLLRAIATLWRSKLLVGQMWQKWQPSTPATYILFVPELG